MKYRFTLLNSAAFLFIIGSLLYTAKNYAVLSKEEGWGLMYSIVLLVFALIADIVIQQVAGSGKRQIKASAIALLLFFIFFFYFYAAKPVIKAIFHS